MRAPILAAAARTGRPPPELAQLVGLSPSVVMDPDGRVPHSVAVRAWETLAHQAADAHLGLFAASLLDAAPVDFVDLALNHAPDLRAVFENFLRFQRLFHQANACSLHVDGTHALAVFRLDAARSRHLCEFVLTTWTRKSARLLGLRALPVEVHLRDAAPAKLEPFHAAFGEAAFRFAAGEDALVFAAELLERPVAGADGAMWQLLRAQLERAVASGAPAFVEQARRRLQVELTQGRADAPTLAKALAVSTRSLQRRLAEHGTSFSELLDGVRRDLALSHLERSDTSITEVAFLLGFSDLSAFSRAFRRWTGRSPIEHRQLAPG